MKRVRLFEDGQILETTVSSKNVPIVGQTNWQKVEQMTDEAIEANALSDPDNLPLSEDEVERLVAMQKAKAIQVK